MEQEQKSLLCHSWKLVNGFCHSSCASELTYVSQAVTRTDVDTQINTHNALTKTLQESSSLLAAALEKLPAPLIEKSDSSQAHFKRSFSVRVLNSLLYSNVLDHEGET